MAGLGEEPHAKSRVVKVDSLESWDMYVTQATKKGCPIIVHFTAAWCMPSVAMNPFFEEVATSYPDVLFLTVDVDEVKEVATKLAIKAMPTFWLMKDGAPLDKLVGANPEESSKYVSFKRPGIVDAVRMVVSQLLGEATKLKSLENLHDKFHELKGAVGF